MVIKIKKQNHGNKNCFSVRHARRTGDAGSIKNAVTCGNILPNGVHIGLIWKKLDSSIGGVVLLEV
jgi:hypothetical protein